VGRLPVPILILRSVRVQRIWMYTFWLQLKRGTSTAVLTCWLWLSLGSAFTHACQNGEFHDPGLRSDVACVSCQWASLEKTAEIESAPSTAEQPLVVQVFAGSPESRVYIPSFLRPGRAPPV
jgi:hypothetical protein